MVCRLFLVLMLLFGSANAVVPLEFEDFFESEAEYIQARQKYQLYLFYNFYESDRLTDNERLQKVKGFLKHPVHLKLFQKSFLDYVNEQESEKKYNPNFINTGIVISSVLGLFMASSFDVSREWIAVPYIIPLGFTTYFSAIPFFDASSRSNPTYSSYAQYIENNPTNLCLSSRYLKRHFDCSEIYTPDSALKALFLQTQSKQTVIREFSVLSSALMPKIDSGVQNPGAVNVDSTTAYYSPEVSKLNRYPQNTQMQVQNIPIVSPLIAKSQVPKQDTSDLVFPQNLSNDSLEILRFWLGQLNSKNPDYNRTESKLALKKMAYALSLLSEQEVDTLNQLSPAHRGKKTIKYLLAGSFLLGGFHYYENNNDYSLRVEQNDDNFKGFTPATWAFFATSATFGISAYLDEKKLEKRQAILERVYNRVQTKQIQNQSTHAEAQFWCEQIQFSECRSNLKSNFIMQDFIVQKGIPDSIYQKRTMLNTHRSHPLWVISKVVLGVISFGIGASVTSANSGPEHAGHSHSMENLAAFVPFVAFLTSLYFDYQYEKNKKQIVLPLSAEFTQFRADMSVNSSQKEEP